MEGSLISAPSSSSLRARNDARCMLQMIHVIIRISQLNERALPFEYFYWFPASNSIQYRIQELPIRVKTFPSLVEHECIYSLVFELVFVPEFLYCASEKPVITHPNQAKGGKARFRTCKVLQEEGIVQKKIFHIQWIQNCHFYMEKYIQHVLLQDWVQ